MRKRNRWNAVGLACLATACGAPTPEPTAFAVPEGAEDAPRVACRHREPHKRALFGDLHVHTALSSDAWNYGVEMWRYAEYDPARDAVYYARVVENPSCRYTAWQCRALAPDARPPGCDASPIPQIQQERAWTSPIWIER